VCLGYPQRKELRPVGNHVLNDVWENKLAFAVRDLLGLNGVKWTSIDVIRIANAGESSAPVILWLGVFSGSVSPADGLVIALACKDLLQQNDIADIDVELRESVVTRSVGPKLLNPAFSADPTVNVRKPLTATLGLSICAQLTSWAEGTGGFFMAEGGDSKRIFLVTARHVMFPPEINDNAVYECKNNSQPRRLVFLLGNPAFQKLLDPIQVAIGNASLMVQHQERRIKAVEGMEGEEADEEHEGAEAELEAKKAMERQRTFYEDVLKQWFPLGHRVFGHVVFAPPISVGISVGGYLEDFAIVEVDTSKIDADSFRGNVMDLGTQIEPGDFTRMMHPHPKNSKSFTYPPDRLLPLRGIIPENEIRNPTMLDRNSDPCIMVTKSGSTTGLTIGRANNIFSYVRHYFSDDKSEISMEWAILPFDSKSGPFSAKGDSGSVIADGTGRMGGLLTGGAGATSSTDITYATPLSFLKKGIAQKFKTAHFDPVFPT
jgi:hypothetical protein